MTRDRSKPILDTILREARKDLVPPHRGPDGDFSAIDAKLFARIAQEQAASPNLTREPVRAKKGRVVYLYCGAALVAAAAAVVLMVRHPSSPTQDANGALARTAESASAPDRADRNETESPRTAQSAASFHERQGSGDLRIAGSVAEPGHALALSESVETAEVRGIFVSGQEARPAVTWLLEERSHVDVRHVQSPLVLALANGAVEAQVAPVDHGEAFAVDIDGVRVAVHGTHLRVSRDAGHVTLDLSEGVVAIGAIPKAGLTEGTVVTAPAHVEFDTADLAASFRIDHAEASVRPPVQLGSHRVEMPSARPTTHDSAVQPDKAAAARSSGSSSAIIPPSARPEESIAKGVRACVANQLRDARVRVTVSSTLSLKVAEDGSVYFARFNPPLSPEAQDCASRIIYKTRFAHGGDVEIPLSSE